MKDILPISDNQADIQTETPVNVHKPLSGNLPILRETGNGGLQFMNGVKVSQAAKSLGLSKVSIHKWVKRLTLLEKGLAYKENGVVFLSEEALRVIEENHRSWNPEPEKPAPEEAVNPPGNPSENPREVNDNLYAKLTDKFGEEVNFLRQELSRRDETIQNLIAKQAEERQRSDSIIMKLAHDLEDTRRSALAIEMKVNTLLEKPADPIPEILTRPAPPVQPWTPPAGKNPAENMGLLERFWTGIVHPERLRRHAEN